MSQFNGDSGRKPQTEARRYVYAVLAAIIANERRDRGGWFFGGIEDEFDKRRLNKALDAVYREMLRRKEG